MPILRNPVCATGDFSFCAMALNVFCCETANVWNRGQRGRAKRVLKTSLMIHQRTCELVVSSRKGFKKTLGSFTALRQAEGR